MRYKIAVINWSRSRPLRARMYALLSHCCIRFKGDIIIHAEYAINKIPPSVDKYVKQNAKDSENGGQRTRPHLIIKNE